MFKQIYNYICCIRYKEKQDDDIYHNYTVARANYSTTFQEGEHELITIKYVNSSGDWIESSNYNSNTDYIVAFIPCIYLCG